MIAGMTEPHRTTLETLDPGTTFRLADWEVDPQALLLRRRQEEQRLEPRVMALLVCLAERAGRAVTRDQLLEQVWHDVIVGDDAIHSAVSKLRRALGNGSGGEMIQTVPKVGYRLVVPVEWQDAPDASATLPEQRPRSIREGLRGEVEPTRERGRETAATARWLAWGLLLPLLLVAGALVWTLGPADVAAPSSRPDARPLTTWPGLEVEPAFAPGDTEDRIAFAWRGPDGENWDIWVQVLGVGDPLRLTSHPGSDHYPAWSPDGRRVAFLRYEEGRCSVMEAPALGGSERRLAGCGRAEGLTWSADGQWLLWAERPDSREPFRIVGLSRADLTRREVTRPAPGSVGDLGPSVSPDGKTLAFLRSPVLGVEDLYLQPLVAGGEPRRLTWDSLKIHGVDWMPDGRSLVFSSNRGGLFSLWEVSRDGDEPTWLGVSGGDLDAPTVGHAGRRIAYEQWSDDTNVYRMPLTVGAEPQRVLGSTRWDWAPDVTGSGDRIVFVSDRTGSSELWTEALEEPGWARQLTDFGGPYVNHPRWSPDGTEVAFDARPAGDADIYLLREGERMPRRITEAPGQDVAPTWSRDGHHLYFASDRGGAWEIWRTPVDRDAATRVTRGGGYFAQESPDGGWLYFTRKHEAGIWRQPLDREGRPELVVEDLVPLDRAHWIVTEHALLYVQRPRHDRPLLTRFDLSTGRVEVVGELGPIPYNSGLSLSPGGDSVLFTRVDRMESDVLVLELDP